MRRLQKLAIAFISLTLFLGGIFSLKEGAAAEPFATKDTANSSVQSMLPDAALAVRAVALFKNKAMLSINGRQLLMRIGDESAEGLQLVSANSREAVVKYNQQTRVLNLSTHITGVYEAVSSASVSIMLNNIGQYKTVGMINGSTVLFLVDTGANILAMNASMAKSLNVDLAESKTVNVTTASGVARSRLVTLALVQVGEIQVSNVAAVVVDGDYPRDILLGMSFLRHVDIQESSGVMNLTAKF
ncbi:MAG: retroviral-like aspartic protease family protein [Pseudomonadales bacterium]|nr:retroviral-like aspartic protease family protein [Pseudomonadales bacterium]